MDAEQEYLMSGWEKYVLSFDVVLFENSVRITPTNIQNGVLSNHLEKWSISIRGSISEPRDKYSLSVLSELLSSPRKHAFTKFWYHLRTGDNETLLKRGKKCCCCVGVPLKYHLGKLECSHRCVVLEIIIVSETGRESSIVDVMSTFVPSTINDKSRSDGNLFPGSLRDSAHSLNNSNYDVDVKPLINKCGYDAIFSSPDITDHHKTRCIINKITEAPARENASDVDQYCKDFPTVWEKHIFNFNVLRSGHIKLRSCVDKMQDVKWSVRGTVVKSPFMRLMISLKLLSSPKKVVFVKFLLHLSAKSGYVITKLEKKYCLRIGESRKSFLKINKLNENMNLDALVISDTHENDTQIDMLDSSTNSNREVFDEYVDSDEVVILDNDDASSQTTTELVRQVSSSSIEGKNRSTTSCVRSPPVMSTNSNTENNFNTLMDSLTGGHISVWERCTYSFRIFLENENKFSSQLLHFNYHPEETSNEWSLSVDLCINDQQKGNIFIIAALKSSKLKKVFAKFFFRLYTEESVLEVFENKSCHNVNENRVHGLKDVVLLSLPVFLEVTIFSEVTKDLGLGYISTLCSHSISNGFMIGSPNTEDSVVLETRDMKLVANMKKLSENSEVFEKIIQDMVSNNKERCITVNEFSSTAICEMLLFIDQKKDLNVCWESGVELLQMSEKYLIKDLKEKCESFLISILNQSNALKLLLHADTYSAIELKEKAVEFICKHQNFFVQDDKYDELNDRPDLLKMILIRVASRSSQKRKKQKDECKKTKKKSLTKRS